MGKLRKTRWFFKSVYRHYECFRVTGLLTADHQPLFCFTRKLEEKSCTLNRIFSEYYVYGVSGNLETTMIRYPSTIDEYVSSQPMMTKGESGR